ncbi:conserved hypothetical protein [Candidatus Zixiibacteriota bacterium]|nr:conserved hypothetical protein [candidate division Zixibacteria bacterium]
MTLIESLYKQNQEIANYLKGKDEVTFASDLNASLGKLLVMAMGSYFECEITNLIMDYITEKTNQHKSISSFVKNKAISRQYHTYFQWKDNNANSFFGLFGEDFKNNCISQVRAIPNLAEGIKAFIEIGVWRNHLAHENFNSIDLPKTAEEFYDLYNKAEFFLSFFKKQLKNST